MATLTPWLLLKGGSTEVDLVDLLETNEKSGDARTTQIIVGYLALVAYY